MDKEIPVQRAMMSGDGFSLELIVPQAISPIHDITRQKMTELIYENTSELPQRVSYNVFGFFFWDYSILRTINDRKEAFKWPRPLRRAPSDVISPVFEPKRRLVLGSVDVMEYCQRFGGAQFFGDGDIEIDLASSIDVDGRQYSVLLGPLRVSIDVHRDWADDLDRYRNT